MFHSSRLRYEAEILSGISISNEMKKRIKMEVDLLQRSPCLAVVQVGTRADSVRYVRNKRLAATACGIKVHDVLLPESISQAKLHEELVRVNTNPDVDGVLLQLPLPPHLRARRALFHINPSKDVDGLHPLNAGNLFIQDQSPLSQLLAQREQVRSSATFADDLLLADSRTEGNFHQVGWRTHEKRFFIPCTALAVRTLLLSYLNRKYHFFSRNEHPDTARRAPHSLHAVVVNQSMVVGVPTSALLQKEGLFVVTMCSRQNSLEELRRVMTTADVLITAYGEPNVFDRSFVKPGAIVIDVATNTPPPDARPDPLTGKTRTLYGDMDFASVRPVAGALTPVPGGVGPLTIAHLMQNVVKAYHIRHNHRTTMNDLYSSFLQMYGNEPVTTYMAGAEGRRRQRRHKAVVVATQLAPADALEDGEVDDDESDDNSFSV
ncbi:methylenetetrahydrofolate dehydrogenase-like protein [Strigomonas culicis]|uniref:Methylenetetrahydrofolate dehydrogenase-like protein n=1 Tax=Strigomonas culicis TaxID=28005 RepID=S9W4R3_9TRYP|nr:methylenetetrahydrofolate dehydrogenase-like protein [Strigomonas culicis]|eukprot:EPY34331.1 methylenetetrahydrofolate dehydrogenase-like protein [Strigomonas culicis]